MIILKPLIGQCLQCLKEPTNELDKNAVAVVRTNSQCKGEVIGYLLQKYSCLYPCFYPCPITLLASLQLEYGLEITVNFHFYVAFYVQPFLWISIFIFKTIKLAKK